MPERFALGLETIYEGYLVHYGRPRLFAPADGDVALLLGDYLYAHGLVRIAALGDVDAVADARGADLALRRAARRRRATATALWRGSTARGALGGAIRERRRGRARARARTPLRVEPRTVHRRVAPDGRLAALADAAEEGLHVITGMLIVGLIFIAVIALGERRSGCATAAAPLTPQPAP